MAKWLLYNELGIFTHLCGGGESCNGISRGACWHQPYQPSIKLWCVPRVHTPSEESIELDYVNNSALTMDAQPAMTLQVVPSPMEVVLVTNITTPAAPEAGTSGPNDTANAVFEHWADIMSSKEAEAWEMDKQAG
ncbi:hypothetical protein C0989_000573 [Termitomyces sp. Mn162]|nr:hypothetical protein C0989_000573 [Termitomyces sp. Mn162]